MSFIITSIISIITTTNLWCSVDLTYFSEIILSSFIWFLGMFSEFP